MLLRTIMVLMVFVVCSLVPMKSYSQAFNPLISFSVESCSLDVALEKLFAEYELNVAFSKAELSKIRIEHYACSYKSVEQVLTDLLKGTDYGFKKIGKQYVIRKNQFIDSEQENVETQEPSTVDLVQEEELHNTDMVWNPTNDTIRIYDTMQIIRTVMRYDTIVKVEQVVNTDTVYKIKYKGLEIPWPKFRDNGWFVTPSIGFGFPKIAYEDKLLAEDASLELRPSSAFVTGLGGGYKLERLSVGMSLSYRSLRYRFMLEQTAYDGDYYVNDTLDSYFVVHPVVGDTTFHYIMDSTYIPLVTTHYSYRDVNRLDYLSLGLFFSFDFWKRQHFRMFVKAGIDFDFLLSNEGSYNNQEVPFHAPMSREQAEPVKFSYFAGIGSAFKVVNRVELVPEVYYRSTYGSLYRDDFQFNAKMSMIGCGLGLTYYF